MRRMTPEQLAEEQRCAHELHMERKVAALTAALLALANAADNVGVLHFDGDDMPPEVQAMQAATVAARRVLGRCEKCGLPPGCPDCRAVHDVGIGA